MAARKKAPKSYAEKPQLEKLEQLEAELREMLADPELAAYVRMSVITQLAKLSTQIEAARPVEEVTSVVSDPIEAIKLRSIS